MQLGKAFGIIVKADVDEQIMHADVDMWHAPSECHGVVSKGEEKRQREARRHAKAVSGLSRRQFRMALKRFYGSRNYDRAYADVFNRRWPFN